MWSQLLLFIISIALGTVLGAAYALFRFIAAKTKLRALNYVFDVLWCGLAFGAFMLLTFVVASGTFHTFSLLGLLAGVGIAGLIFGKIKGNKTNTIKTTSQTND